MEEQLIYIIMFVSIAMSALCSMLEATLLSTPLSYITGLEEQGRKGAEKLKKLKQEEEFHKQMLILKVVRKVLMNITKMHQKKK